MKYKKCPSCSKKVIATQPRMAESPCNTTDNKQNWRTYKVIGRVYYHVDGTLCDESLYRLEKLRKPVFLKLGNPEIDPRI